MMAHWLIALLQTGLFIAIAPLFAAWVKRIKSYLLNRRGPSLFQPYRDLEKLFRKEILIPDSASVIFRIAPYLVFSVMVVVSSVIPFIAAYLPTTTIADLIVLVGLFALARFFLALAGMDIGTVFGGMGSSREMTIASLAEPALLMVVFTLSMIVSSSSLSTIMSNLLQTGFILRPSFIFLFMSIVLVAIAETGRIPIDNPDTHLELTMIHKALILEYSGRHLALMEWASQMKFMLFGVLIIDIFFPWGIATHITPLALIIGAFVIILKLMFLGAALAVSETMLAKMRLFRVPQLLSFAFILALLGLITHIALEMN